MIKTKIILNSIDHETGSQLTTFLLKYPRYIHSEVMTHRVFSRNSSSSRAIPVTKYIQAVQDDPVIPVFMENKKGMAATEKSEFIDKVTDIWLESKDSAIKFAEQLQQFNIHKQIINRLLEPYSHIHVILTATDFNNFFNLRIHSSAQQEIRLLAESMKRNLEISKPKELFYGDWHLPFIQEKETFLSLESKKKVSVARCARVSYLNHDNSEPVLEKDLELYDKLLSSKHLSPFEHQATPGISNIQSNFRNWIQLRKLVE